jgi:alcohol dehydrogenase
MKALVYTGTEEMRYREEPVRELDAGEALVHIDAVGICGSDMHAYHGHDSRRVPPMILGHEATGLVEHGALLGKRVTMNPLITCGYCDFCASGRSNLCSNRTMIGMTRPGAFAEYVTIPERCLIELPDDMQPVVAALTEPAATALHAVNLAQRAAIRPLSEGRALVLGAGSIGLLTALLLKAQGCRNIWIGDTNGLRRTAAEAAQCGRVYDPVDGPKPANDSFEVVFDAVGAVPTRQASIDAVKPGGVILHIGLLQGSGEMNVRKLTLAEITFMGAYTYSQLDLKAAAKALYDGALGPLDWIQQRPLSDGADAFADLHHGRMGSPKIVLIP